MIRFFKNFKLLTFLLLVEIMFGSGVFVATEPGCRSSFYILIFIFFVIDLVVLSFTLAVHSGEAEARAMIKRGEARKGERKEHGSF